MKAVKGGWSMDLAKIDEYGTTRWRVSELNAKRVVQVKRGQVYVGFIFVYCCPEARKKGGFE